MKLLVSLDKCVKHKIKMENYNIQIGLISTKMYIIFSRLNRRHHINMKRQFKFKGGDW